MLTTVVREIRGEKTVGFLAAVALASVVLVAPAALSAPVLAHGEDEDEDRMPFRFETRRSAYLGVSIREESDLGDGGARVVYVIEGSPAAEGGIEDGDLIVEFDGKAIGDAAGLTEILQGKEPGDQIRIDVMREGIRESLQVVLGDRSETRARSFVFREDHFPGDDPGLADHLREMVERLKNEDWGERLQGFSGPRTFELFMGRPRLGVQLVETTPELREHLGGSEDAGVLVSKVLPDTPAASAGVEVGDLILSVDGQNVSTSAELVMALAEKEGQIELKVVRDGKKIKLRPELAKDEDEPMRGPRARLLRDPQGKVLAV